MAAPSPSLTPAAITAVQVQWRAALDSPTGLSDADRVDAIRALEELVCTATAAQAALARELDASTRRAHALSGLPASKRGAGVSAQIALARRVSPHRGQRQLGLAKIVPDELPHTWAAWRAGSITEWKVTLIARETACVSLEHRLEIDTLVSSDALVLERMGERELVAACATHAARLDAASVTKRRRKAESQRCVTLRPAPDTMTYLTALLPVKDGVAAHAALLQAAAAAHAAGDVRGKGQVMADELVRRTTSVSDGNNGGDSFDDSLARRGWPARSSSVPAPARKECGCVGSTPAPRRDNWSPWMLPAATSADLWPSSSPCVTKSAAPPGAMRQSGM